MGKEVEQQEITADTQDVEVKKTSGSNKLVWFVLFLLLCVNAGGGYWLWFQQQTINNQIAQKIDSVKAVPAAPVNLSKFKQSIADVESELQNQVASLRTEQQSLVESIAAINTTDPETKKDAQYLWAMAEVDYLLNIANQRVLLSFDPVGAKAALNLADSRIESVQDYRLHPLRALIAEEVLALSSVNQVDIQDIALKLSSAIQKVDSLQVLNDSPGKSNAEAEEVINGDGWKSALSEVWHQVKSLVVIRHQQDGASAVLVPEQRYFLYQNLRLQLESAQRALLSGQSVIYKTNLTASAKWLETYFIGTERDALLALVNELASIDITTELPDVSASLTWLRGFNK